MRWLWRLEYKQLGKKRVGDFYIARLMTIVVAGMVAVLIADMMLNVSLISLLTLNRAAVLQGQVWRLITFIFVPPSSTNAFLLVISLYFYWIMGNSLENIWGGWKLNFYYLLGILGAWAAMFISGYASNYYLNMSLFLAFATLGPDTTFMLFFILPIKAKWMALLSAAFMAFDIINAFLASPVLGVSALVTLAFSLLNYLIFFGPRLLGEIRDQARIAQNRRNWKNK